MGSEFNDALLRRAIEAEEARDEAQAKLADLRSRLRAALGADPTTAVRALSWIGRAEQAEQLLRALLRRIDQRSVETGQFPDGWVAQAQAQLKAVEVMRRDLGELFERPEEGDNYLTALDASGHRIVVRETG